MKNISKFLILTGSLKIIRDDDRMDAEFFDMPPSLQKRDFSILHLLKNILDAFKFQ
ncbi:MAG: hypothetical protein J6P03_04980 [Opitutales bacterium]|nr:hypothetical protein [Opitutales bacterium]